MIYMELGGRLGNQLFRYAFTRALIYERNVCDELIVGVTSYISRDSKQGFVNNLNNLKTMHFGQVEKSIFYFYPFVLRLLYRIICQIPKILKYDDATFEHKFWKVFNHMGILTAHYDNYNFKISKLPTLFVDGDFQNYEYFDHIKPILQKEFQPKHLPLVSNDALYQVIEHSNSVCVHIRRGDYLSEEYRQNFYVCDEDYYNKAIKVILQKVENPHIIFFSNDIAWVKANIHVNAPCYYEPSDNPLWESFRMMYSCKHFVISNSTLSWWCQYLSPNTAKVVVSPDHWFNNKMMDAQVKLLMPSFITIKCPYHD